jgi:uncharacterized protein YxeA
MSQPPPVPPTKKSGPKWLRILTGVFAIVVMVITGLTWFGHQLIVGNKYAATTKETVDYSGNSTKEDAKALGEELKKIGYFDNSKEKDVLLHQDQSGTVISFVVNATAWTDEEMLNAFKTVGDTLATDLNLHQLKLRLIDDHLNTKKEIAIN